MTKEQVAEKEEKTITITESALMKLIENFKSGEGAKVEQEVDPRMTADYIEELAFMEERVQVLVHETTDKNERPVVTVGVNGRYCNFPRGIVVDCPRYFLNALIVRGHAVSTPEVEVKSQDGGTERTRAIRKTSALRYPFSVVYDKNKKGAEWLRRRIAEEQ